MELKEVFSKNEIQDTQNFARRFSPCSRRKYGTLIKDNFGNLVFGANERVGKYCTDKLCARDYMKVPHASNVEIGGEVHAEQSALIKWSTGSIAPEFDPQWEGYEKHILVAGFNHDDSPLAGQENFPCHVCAMMIKYAGFDHVWLADGSAAYPWSLNQILEHYESAD